MDSTRDAQGKMEVCTMTPTPPEATPHRASEPAQPSTTPPRVLIVDDDAGIRDVLNRLFTDDGFNAICCGTTQKALAVLAGEPVQLVVTDLRLAGGTGIELIHHVRARYVELPGIIVLTAVRPVHAAAELEQLERMGARVIAKPFDVDDLLGVAHALTGWAGHSLQ